MIKTLTIENYRSLRSFVLSPGDGLNLIVGKNAAGKSTLLEALTMVLNGRLNGRGLYEQLNPYWFNQAAVREFFAGVEAGGRPHPPEIRIEVEFHPSEDNARLRGTHGRDRRDVPGCYMHVGLDPELIETFWDHIDRGEHHGVLPHEYFTVRWESFGGKPLRTIAPPARVLNIDGTAERSNLRIDNYAREILTSVLTPAELSDLSVRHRHAMRTLTDSSLSTLNEGLRQEPEAALNGPFGTIGIHLDFSATNSWTRGIGPALDEFPLAFVGQGEQTQVKLALALKGINKADVVTIEEPENHLSHTSLHRVLSLVESLCSGKQAFISTHSSYVLNRLGLDQIHLLANQTANPLMGVKPDTVQYFKKLSGFDTLRVVLADCLVLVEGPSDEMVFRQAWEQKTGSSCEAVGIDVMAVGTAYKRALELCSLLDRDVAILRDCDDATPEHWRSQCQQFLAPGKRGLFVGEPGCGRTLEPQMTAANAANLAEFASNIGCSGGVAEVEAWMSKNKTDWALNLAESGARFDVPSYIGQAVEFVLALQ